MRGKDSVIVPYSKIKHDLVNVLIEEGYLNSCEKIDNGGKDEISVNLKSVSYTHLTLPTICSV